MAEKNYEFHFMTLPAKVTLTDNELHYKYGVQNKKILLYSLRYLYVIHHPEVGLECVLAYEKPNGRLKKLRINSNFGEKSFNELVDQLVFLKPHIDLRSKTLAEANKIMGAAKIINFMPVIVVGLGLLIVSFFFLPVIVHAFDGGMFYLDASECKAECHPTSRNIILKNGYLYINEYLEETRDRSPYKNYYLAFVPYDWTYEQPVYLIVKTSQLSEDMLASLAEEETLPVVLRDVLWEGLSQDVKNHFKSKLNMEVATEARLFEYGADIQRDFIIFMVVAIIVISITLIVSLIVLFKYRKLNA